MAFRHASKALEVCVQRCLFKLLYRIKRSYIRRHRRVSDSRCVFAGTEQGRAPTVLRSKIPPYHGLARTRYRSMAQNNTPEGTTREIDAWRHSEASFDRPMR